MFIYLMCLHKLERENTMVTALFLCSVTVRTCTCTHAHTHAHKHHTSLCDYKILSVSAGSLNSVSPLNIYLWWRPWTLCRTAQFILIVMRSFTECYSRWSGSTWWCSFPCFAHTVRVLWTKPNPLFHCSHHLKFTINYTKTWRHLPSEMRDNTWTPICHCASRIQTQRCDYWGKHPLHIWNGLFVSLGPSHKPRIELSLYVVIMN